MRVDIEKPFCYVFMYRRFADSKILGSLTDRRIVLYDIIRDPDGSFRPGASITREQLAAMLYRFARHLDCDLTASASLDGFVDAGSVHEYARDAMAWAVGRELLQGRSGSTLAPGGTASRGEMAVILSRFAEISGLGSKS